MNIRTDTPEARLSTARQTPPRSTRLEAAIMVVADSIRLTHVGDRLRELLYSLLRFVVLFLLALAAALLYGVAARAEPPSQLAVRRVAAQETLPAPPQPLPRTPYTSAPVSPLLKKHDLRVKPMTELTVNIAPKSGELPHNYAKADMFDRDAHPEDINAERPWAAPMTFAWEAPSLCHGPLYFEEINIERYGYSFGCLQPAVSAAHFFGTFPLLPYMMTVQPPRECVYTLGLERPGDCVPFECHHYPFELSGASVEGAFVTGMVFLIP